MKRANGGRCLSGTHARSLLSGATATLGLVIHPRVAPAESRLFIRMKPGNQSASYAPFGVSQAMELPQGLEP